MNEKIYKTLGNAGIANLVTGIVIIVTGLAAGILLIIHGVKLLNNKKNVMI